ncbi:MAG: hypothetical protein H6685_07130 [Deltaproteobacteria bacterium]|nr:hypothetical protein [Deltaproteobacteria bacterium]
MLTAWKQWGIALALALVYLATQSGIANDADQSLYDVVHAMSTGDLHAVDLDSLVPGSENFDPKAAYQHRAIERPGMAFFAVPFHLLGVLVEHLAGTPDSPNGLAAQFTLVAGACLLAWCALLVYCISREFGCRPRAARTAMLLFAVASIALPFGGRLSEGALACLAVLLFFYCWQRVRSRYDQPYHQLGLGVGLMLMPIAHDLTLLLFPIFLVLTALLGKRLFSDKYSAALIFLPVLLGILIFGAFNKALHGYLFFRATGEHIVQTLLGEYTGASMLRGLSVLLFNGRDVIETLKAAFSKPEAVIALRGSGLLIATPVLWLTLFGILNLRAEALTRPAINALFAIVLPWVALACGHEQPPHIPGPGTALVMPVLGLLFVLIASFYDNHLLALKFNMWQPIFAVALAYTAFLSFSSAVALIMERTAAHAAAGALPVSMIELWAKTPTNLPTPMSVVEGLSLLFPALGNLPLLGLPAAGVLALPLIARRALHEPATAHRIVGGDNKNIRQTSMETTAYHLTQSPGAKDYYSDVEHYRRMMEELEGADQPEVLADKVAREGPGPRPIDIDLSSDDGEEPIIEGNNPFDFREHTIEPRRADERRQAESPGAFDFRDVTREPREPGVEGQVDGKGEGKKSPGWVDPKLDLPPLPPKPTHEPEPAPPPQKDITFEKPKGGDEPDFSELRLRPMETHSLEDSNAGKAPKGDHKGGDDRGGDDDDEDVI